MNCLNIYGYFDFFFNINRKFQPKFKEIHGNVVDSEELFSIGNDKIEKGEGKVE